MTIEKCNLCGVRCESLPDDLHGKFKFIGELDPRPQYLTENIEECPIVRSLKEE
jgi:hypothetical protein